MNALDKWFGVSEAGSTVQREVVGGLTTFATMSYIVFVQPTVLSACGMPFGSVLVATCLSSAIACFLMAYLARYPIALAPGMGENFFFAFTVCSTFPGAMGFSWQAGLTIVFISGLIFLALSLVGARERLLRVLPDCLKNAIGPGIGLFIAFVGLQWSGIITTSPTTMVHLGSLKSGPALISVAGVFLIAALMTLGIRGGILIGVLVSAGLGLATGVLPKPEETFQIGFETFFQFNVSELITHWDKALIAILLFFFMDLFDTVGTLVGVGKQAGFIKDDGDLPRAGGAFAADAAATCVGACMGTSTVTSYVESATGVAAGARTGLAAVVTGFGFIFAIALAPIVHIVGQDVGPAFYGTGPADLQVAMYPAVAPALIVVGFLMMRPFAKVNWDDLTESLPAFFTVAIMVFGFAIHEGIAAGCVSYAAIKTATGRYREVHPIMFGIAIALIARYAFL
ncbi:MAG: guanine permease [Candidatus Hydrogenedentota bacterium]